MAERPYTLTVTIKVPINGDTKELAIDHLAKMIVDFGLEGIEMAALDTITAKLDGEEYKVPARWGVAR
jgi:hypothetical protein